MDVLAARLPLADDRDFLVDEKDDASDMFDTKRMKTSQARSLRSISRSQSAPPSISRSSQISTAPCFSAGLR